MSYSYECTDLYSYGAKNPFAMKIKARQNSGHTMVNVNPFSIKCYCTAYLHSLQSLLSQ